MKYTALDLHTYQEVVKRVRGILKVPVFDSPRARYWIRETDGDRHSGRGFGGRVYLKGVKGTG